MRTILAAMALLAGLVTPAGAQEAGPCIWIVPEGVAHEPGTEATVTISYGVGDGDGSHESGDFCNREAPPAPESPLQVDVEITGANDPDASDSRDTPDLTCELPEVTGSSCTVSYFGADVGEDVLRAWIDSDHNDATDERDDTEGSFEGQEPGEIAEPDGTEVAALSWRVPECRDGIDNDDDGATDYPDDPDCSDASGDFEQGPICVCAPPACMQSGIRNMIIGTQSDDEIYGTHQRDCVWGAGGNDILHGLGGNDLIIGAAGSDVMFGGRGADQIQGRQGRDALAGSNGDDRLNGGDGADSLRGHRGFDRALGGADRDSCRAERTRSCEGVTDR